jgi:hypothetical protein
MATRQIRNERYKCDICDKRRPENQYYKAGRTKAGLYHICKMCIQTKTKHNNVEYVQSVLKDMDYAFIRSLWDKVFHKYADTAFGHYLASLRIGKYGNLTYEGSIFEDDSAEDEYDELVYNEKWRGTFSVSDLNYLEKYYDELHRDYKITTTNHKDYAKKIAKASLAMDKAYERMLYDRNDNSAAREFKELKGIFDDLCKSAQFSESTRSANDYGLGSFGVIFNMIEANEWIPEHKPLNKDLYDKLLDQFSNISKSL